MKIIIFAGGTGTRLWPLSRQNSPKQFGKIFNGKSTLQLAIERVESSFGAENVYISTNEKYVSLIKNQIPQISTSNILAEPEKRDLAGAVGYNFMRFRKVGYKGPVAILWADHLMEREKEFVKALKKGERLVKENPKRIAFIGERPRFANHNLGWIHVGKKLKDAMYEFVEWHYRPPLEKCKKIFASGDWYWNPGYFIADLDFVIGLYEKHMPEMYAQLSKIEKAIGTVEEAQILKKIYPQLESISFDDAIIQKVPPEQGIVISVDMGWSDPGTLYALKEALTDRVEENYTKGFIYNYETKDSLIINEDKEKLIATIGLNGFMVINTKDAILVVHKDNVPKVKKLVNEFKKDKELKKYI